MSNYLITLSPIGKFFFGGDMTFTVNGKETEYTSYIIKSNKFPQQTSLLGMLRFLMVSNSSKTIFSNGHIVHEYGSAQLIGYNSFRVNQQHQENNYRKIKRLSPCRLQKECAGHWFDLYVAPADYGMNVDFENVTSASLNGKAVEIPKMDYSAKDYGEPMYICAACAKIMESTIFRRDIRNGINRDIKTGLVADDALFKEVSYQLERGYRFAFEAEVDDLSGISEHRKTIADYSGQVVKIGANSSMFVIGIEEKKNEKSAESASGKRLVLSSPAFLTDEDMQYVRFAVAQAIPFRCIQTDVTTTNYNCTNPKNTYSKKYNLYNTGSVFYFKNSSDCNNFANALKKKKDFSQIGYNHYEIINL